MTKPFMTLLALALLLGVSVPAPLLQAADAISANGFNCKNFDDGRVMCRGKFPFNPDLTLSSIGRDSVAIIADFQGKSYSYTSRNGCYCIATPDLATKKDQYDCTSKKGEKRVFAPKEPILSYQTWCEMN
jgi:hypothetical protein